MSDEEFWIFRRHDGHVTVSSREHPDEAGKDDYPDGKPDESTGEWLNVDTFAWINRADPCMRGVCGHGRKLAVTEESWQEAIAKVVPVFEMIRDQVAVLWEATMPTIAGVVELCHRMRIEGDHDGLCPGPTPERKGQRCFCTCLACLSTAGECECAHCGCAVKA